MPQPARAQQGFTAMAPSSVWQSRWINIVRIGAGFLLAATIYLASELLIWGLSQTLAPVKLEFFAAILGMMIIFTLSTVALVLWREAASVYQRRLKGTVDFINSHLGLGFPVPLIMLDGNEILEGSDIGRVIATFLTTNVISWSTAYLLSLAIIAAISHFRERLATKNYSTKSEKMLSPSSSGEVVIIPLPKEYQQGRNGCRDAFDSERDSSESFHDIYGEQSSQHGDKTCAVWNLLATHYPIILSLASTFILGVPLAVAVPDGRFLDASVLCFFWISAVRSQRAFKISRVCALSPYFKRGLATTMNPVLVTTLLMTGYTRAKSSAYGTDGLARVLKTFSGGTPLYALWTAKVKGIAPSNNPSGWFGAGDAALSILECGILIWGFKLSECRRQIFSVAGLVTVLVCAAAAIGNVFLSTLAARAMGLASSEALSFAARSTTLALSKPATQSIGGNIAVNAALVVSNGILGQLMYPFALDRLGVCKQDKSPMPSTAQADTDHDMAAPTPSHNQLESGNTRSITGFRLHERSEHDSPVTIAAGIAIGINGAAMGVSYLYEAKSRAASYAALSMAVFGVMTVMFTTVEPFKDILVGLTN